MIDSSGTFYVAYILVAVVYIAYSVSLGVRASRFRRQARNQNAGSLPE